MTHSEAIDYAAFARDGFVVARGLFTPGEVQDLLDHYTRMHANGGEGWTEKPIEPDSPDPLRRYPRILQPHRGDPKSLEFLLDERFRQAFVEMLGTEPYAVQTMVYFKPPGARGQALHQDQRYLRVDPGTCVAAWLALDDTDAENGCLQVVPGTQNMDLLCPVESDRSQSFTRETVPIPPGLKTIDLPMKKGDVIFFNGQLVHGSGPNRSSDRFRRIVVGHYIVGEAQKVAKYYFPVYRFDGTTVELEVNEGGGSCGTFTAEGSFTMNSTVEEALAAH
ncbi:phytanoyl-CoA dioxygenase family protein [bacterium]|nr:MAG: phytanoyl-CoA dioxygenase family protein [bacterium]